jgi:chemotaxis signal transduction protein
MDVGGGYRVAAGAYQVVEYLLSPETVSLPLTPAHCRGVMIWRKQMIPVVDLAPLLPGGETRVRGWRRAVVLAYQETPGEPLRYGALLVRAAPLEIFADDGMACPLPGDPEVFRHFACSCFTHDNKATPVLDIARLFARPLPRAALPGESEAETTVNIVESAWATPLGLASTDAPDRTSAPPVWQVLDAGHAPQVMAHTPGGIEKNIPGEGPHEANQASPGPVEADASRAETTASADAAAFDGALSSVEVLSVPGPQEPPDSMAAAQTAEAAPGATLQETRSTDPGTAACLRADTHRQAPHAHVRVSTLAKQAAMTFGHSLRRRDALDHARHCHRRNLLRAALAGALLVSLVLAAIVFMAPREKPLVPATQIKTGPASTHERGEAVPEAPAARDIAPDPVGTISAPSAPARPPH